MPSIVDYPRSGCPISSALEIFGDRWTLVVLRDIMLNAKYRYKELLACEEGIATNVLADRLKRLETHNLILKQKDATDARQFIYQPTELSISLVPMLLEMIVWGAKNYNTNIPLFIMSYESDREKTIAELKHDIRVKSGLME